MYVPEVCFMFVGFLCLSLFLLCIALCTFKICNHLEEEEKVGCFTITVLQKEILCGYSSQCHGLVCFVCLWYFLIILANFFILTNACEP